MKPIWELADFIRAVRRQMRFGEISRAPLRLLRLEWRGEAMECDWIVRDADRWDDGLRSQSRERNVAVQALHDAIRLRDLLFASLPGVQTAALRAFRQSEQREPPELIIAGTVRRKEKALASIRSLAMRVKLCGLQFRMDDGKLKPLREDAARYVQLAPRTSRGGLAVVQEQIEES